MNNLTLTEHAKSKSCPFRMEAECHGSYCMAWMQTTELSGFCGLAGDPRILDILEARLNSISCEIEPIGQYFEKMMED